MSQGSNAEPAMLQASNVKSSTLRLGSSILGFAFVDGPSDMVGRTLSARYLLSMSLLRAAKLHHFGTRVCKFVLRQPFGVSSSS